MKSLLGKGGTTDFQVRPCGIRRTRKSVVPLNQQPASQSGRSGRRKVLSRYAIELSAFSIKQRGWLARPSSISIPFGQPWLRVQCETKQHKVFHADVLRKIQPLADGQFNSNDAELKRCLQRIPTTHSHATQPTKGAGTLRRAVRSHAFVRILGGRQDSRWTAHGMCLLLCGGHMECAY